MSFIIKYHLEIPKSEMTTVSYTDINDHDNDHDVIIN